MHFSRRDPVSLVDAPETAEARKVYSEMVNQRTPSAARHLILVRHGEYVHMDTNDSQCVLTSLGMHCFEYEFYLYLLNTMVACPAVVMNVVTH